ncbi:MAG: hypothetical protein PHP47_03360 [Candidatus Pacebacteria bacterium]|nr:hypothetical protein [Candidatus Paceibacterota bacterium]
MKRRKQNHKISFHFLSGSPHTPRRKWIGKEIFGFGSRPEGARGAHCSLHHAIGAYVLGKSHHALRACVSPQNPADFAHTMFELRPETTANFHFCPKRQERACREATQNAIFALRAKVFSETEKARGRARGGSFEQGSKQSKSFATNLFVRPVGRCKAIFNFDCPHVKFSI